MNKQNPQIIQKQNYTIITSDIVASGKRGQILRCSHKNKDEQLCVKVISKSHHYVNQQNEIQVIEKLKNSKEKHLNVLQINDIIEENDRYYIFTELCDANLEQLFEDKQKNNIWFTQDEIFDFLGQIVRGYQYLRSLKIILRDLTPKSILFKKLSNDRIVYKISDFGVSKITQDGFAVTKTGIPFYSAPEVYINDTNQKRYNDSCDIYSLGIILYMMCYKGEKPGNVSNFKDLNEFHEKLRENQLFKCPVNLQYSKEFCQLIEKMIVFNPETRIKWEDLDLNLPQQFIILNDIYYADLNNNSGLQGVSYQAYDLKYNTPLVCQIIQNNIVGINRVIENLEKIKQKSHKNIVEIVNINKQDPKFTYIFMEKCNISLQGYLEDKQKINQKLQSQEIIEILYQIVQGYCFLKEIPITQCELKPTNILLKMIEKEKYIVKLQYHQINKNNGNSITNPEVELNLFAAPEIPSQGNSSNQQSDMFTLGVILYYMAFSKMIKDIRNKTDLLQFYKSLEYQNFVCPNYENPLIPELINQMIVSDPKKRITWKNLQDHPIFKPQQQQQQQQQQLLLQQQQQQQSNKNQSVSIEIYEYIGSLHTLALKLLATCEEQQIDDNITQDQILLFKQFIIRFCMSCLKCIDTLKNNNILYLEQTKYQLKSPENFTKWLQSRDFEKLKQQAQEKYKSLREVKTRTPFQIIAKGNQILEQLDDKFKQQQNNQDFIVIHNSFNTFFKEVRPQILSSNIKTKAKFFLIKFSNVFIDFPIKNFEYFSETKIAQRICVIDVMEDFVQKNLQQN